MLSNAETHHFREQEGFIMMHDVKLNHASRFDVDHILPTLKEAAERHKKADEANIGKDATVHDSVKYEHANDYLRVLTALISSQKATTAHGALAQVIVMEEDIMCIANSDYPPDIEDMLRRLHRNVYSVLRVLEQLAQINIEDMFGRYFASSCRDPYAQSKS
jgi:hypothetical protein